MNDILRIVFSLNIKNKIVIYNEEYLNDYIEAPTDITSRYGIIFCCRIGYGKYYNHRNSNFMKYAMKYGVSFDIYDKKLVPVARLPKNY